MMRVMRAASGVAQPVAIPLASGAVNGTTTGPATPFAPSWICVPTDGSVMFDTLMSQQISPEPGLNVTVAVPAPSGSPGSGTSSAPENVTDAAVSCHSGAAEAGGISATSAKMIASPTSEATNFVIEPPPVLTIDATAAQRPLSSFPGACAL